MRAMSFSIGESGAMSFSIRESGAISFTIKESEVISFSIGKSGDFVVFYNWAWFFQYGSVSANLYQK